MTRIYTDLDQTLVNPILGGPAGQDLIDVVPRPGAGDFLKKIAAHGEVWILTLSRRNYAKQAYRLVGPASKLVRGILSAEDLEPIESQIQVIITARGLSDQERIELWKEIRPIAPKGVVFDDFPVGSPMFAIKSTAIGIGPESWIHVDPFTDEKPDRGGLRKAYLEFVARFGKRPVVSQAVPRWA